VPDDNEKTAMLSHFVLVFAAHLTRWAMGPTAADSQKWAIEMAA
jgi:hypothetical protein